MRKWLLSFLLVNFAFWTAVPPVFAKTGPLKLTVKSSPNAENKSTLILSDRRLIRTIRHAKEVPARAPLPLTDTYLSSGGHEWILGKKGYVFNVKDEKRLALPILTEKKLTRYAKLLRKKHYGTLLPWKKVNKLLPRKSTFTVVDLETGRHFQVQRRAGSAHADVQPLTKEDTKIMKEIYDGHWSWRRRAILVKTDGRKIAASMHGMPHGAGALQNGFPGHFCIHFYGSTTHRTRKLDPSHALMVYQAAGKLYDYMENATPYEVVDAFLVAANQKNSHMLKLTLSRENPSQIEDLADLLEDMQAIKNTSALKNRDARTLVSVKIPVDVRIYREGRGLSRKTLIFRVARQAPGERWLIDVDPLLESLK